MPFFDKSDAVFDLQSVHLSQIADATPDAIIAIDADQIVQYANPAAISMFRCEESAMVGQSLQQFIPERFRADHRAHMKAFGQTEVKTRRMSSQRPVSGLRADGTEFPIEASISHAKTNGRQLYTVILRDISERFRTQSELDRAQERLRQLTVRLQSIREDEHRHIARELHDDIGQRLSVTKMDIARIKAELPADLPELYDLVDRVDEMLSETVTAVRGLATGLRPKILDDLGLAAALDSYAQEINNRFPLQCRLNVDDQIEVSPDQAITIFRIVQEAVHNTCKHANATVCDILLEKNAYELELIIADDGCAMQQGDEDKDGSLGLVGIRERVASLNGSMTIDSKPGAGTTITCRFPPAPLADTHELANARPR